jgi:hypothetical protein
MGLNFKGKKQRLKDFIFTLFDYLIFLKILIKRISLQSVEFLPS